MRLAAFAIMAAMILLLGCTYPSAPPPGAQNPQGQTTPPQQKELTGTGTQPPAPEPQPVTQTPPKKMYTCSLTLTPSTIYAGDSTDIGFAVSTKDDVVFTYNCGDEVREISTGGLTGGERLCQFNTAGDVTVWIKADGDVCAQKTLTVLPGAQKPRTCSVNLTSKDLQTYNYQARVNFQGFPSPVKLSWTCDFTTHTQTYYADSGTGIPLYEDISCEYQERPRNDYINVSIDGMPCGQISTR